jgi:hypothetical protein
MPGEEAVGLAAACAPGVQKPTIADAPRMHSISIRILFTDRPTTGHFLPLVPSARTAMALGHKIAFASAEPIVSQARAAGFQIFPAGQDDGASMRGWGELAAYSKDLAI